MAQTSDNNHSAPTDESGSRDQGRVQPRNTQPVDAHTPAPLVFVVPLVAGLLLNRWISWKLFPDGGFGDAVGWSLIIGALLLILWARSTMAASGETIFSREPTNTLVAGGPFKFSRNPIYVAYAMIYVGVAFNVNTLWPIVVLPAVIVFCNRAVIRVEERYLERLFGGEYLQYKARVRRWL